MPKQGGNFCLSLVNNRAFRDVRELTDSCLLSHNVQGLLQWYQCVNMLQDSVVHVMILHLESERTVYISHICMGRVCWQNEEAASS